MSSPPVPAESAALAPSEIAEVALFHVALPLRLPFEASHGTEATREVVVVRVESFDGRVGFGECDALSHPTYTHEYAAGAFALLRDEVVPALLRHGHSAGLDRWHPMARTALQTARLDAALRGHGRRLVDALADAFAAAPPASAAAPPANAAAATGELRQTVDSPVSAVLSAGSPAAVRAVPAAQGNGGPGGGLARTVVLGRAADLDQLLSWVGRAVAEGAGMVKLKVAGPDDLRTYRSVRREFPTLALAADANGALGGLDAAALRQAGLDALELAYLEQPYPPADLLAVADLRRGCATPICLDESIGSLGDAQVALALDALDVINVKPARLGGVFEAVALLRWASDAGVAAFCGGMLELGIGRAAAVAVAAIAAQGRGGLPTDLGPSRAYVAEDLTDAVDTDAAGRLLPPSDPGIGVSVHPERLAAATIASATLTRSTLAQATRPRSTPAPPASTAPASTAPAPPAPAPTAAAKDAPNPDGPADDGSTGEGHA